MKRVKQGCIDCGKVVYGQRCFPCRTEYRRVNILPHRIRFCIDCRAMLKARHYAANRCRTCSNKDPDRIAVISSTKKAEYKDPIKRAALVDRLLKSHERHSDPIIKAKIAAGKKKGGRTRTNIKLAWCPEEYRDYYRRLSRRERFDKKLGKWRKIGAAKARQKVERSFGGPYKQVSVSTPEMDYMGCKIDGVRYRISPMQHRVLTTLLLQNPDRHVPTTELVERIWENHAIHLEVPEQNIRMYIYQLRNVGVCIANNKLGYRIPKEARGVPDDKKSLRSKESRPPRTRFVQPAGSNANVSV